MEEWDLDAFFQLTLIVFEARIGLREEKKDGSDVCQYHESHEEVGKIPDEREVSQRAPEDHDSDADAEKIERPFLFCQVEVRTQIQEGSLFDAAPDPFRGDQAKGGVGIA